jgi:sigma-B regulation protein RsbU (phosphoserine phosphatase)
MAVLLSEWGYEVLKAADGKEAWEIFQKEPIRIIVTDLLMPGMDGIELCKMVRSEKKGFYTYIIVVTGLSDQVNLYDALFAGADDFIMKPWQNPEVRARLRTGERILHLEDELQDRIGKLEEANLLIRTANDRMKKEIEFMNKIQSSLLPSELAKFENFNIAWKHQPQSILCGDGLNIFRLDESHVAIYILDVSGSGPAASYMLASLSRKMVPIPGQPGILKNLSIHEPGYSITEPKTVLKILNCAFPLDLETNQFFTIFYGIYNFKTGHLKYSTAGHPPPMVIKGNGKYFQLEGSGHPIGFVDNSEFEQWNHELEVKDRLYLFTDGVSNSMDQSMEPFGRKRMLEFLRGQLGYKLEDSVEGVFRASKEWSSTGDFADDVSIFAIEISRTE